MSKKQDNKKQILQALQNSPTRWRTAQGLAKDTGIADTEISRILEQSREVIRAKKSGSHGRVLYALIEKRTIVNELNESEVDNEISTDRSLTYLILAPFDPSSQRLRDTVKHSVLAEGGKPDFLNNFAAGASWVDEILQRIRASDVVIADITLKNPNVMFELGIAHTVGKPLILLVNERIESDIPSDLLGYQYLTYDADNLSMFVERLSRTVRHLQARGGKI